MGLSQDESSARAQFQRPPGSSLQRVLFWVILLIGLLLRLYRLDEQSFWWDEYALTGYLRVPSFPAYIALVRLYTPDYAPLPFLILYPWSLIAGTSVFACRLLYALFSVGAIPVLFLLVRRVWDTRAALTAALLLAVSPMHIWFGQAAQSYPVMDFLAVASLYALVRALDGGKRWWVAHFAANFLLMSNHLFAVCFLTCILAFLLLFYRRRPLIAAWTGFHIVAVALPAAFVAATVKYIPPEAQDHYEMPTAWQILIDLFGDDAVRWSLEFPFSQETWSHMPETLYQHMVKTQPFVDACLVGLSTMFLILAVLALMPRSTGRLKDIWHERSFQGGSLLLLVFLLPVIQLAVVSFVWRPCLMSRYTLYSSSAGYALIGYVLSKYQRRMAVKLLFLAFLATIAFQLVMSLPAVSRTNWIKAATIIRDTGSRDDVVFVKGLAPHAYDTFRANMGPQTATVAPLLNLRKFYPEAATLFERPSGAPSNVWCVFENPIVTHEAFQEQFDRLLAPRGLSFTWQEFEGMQRLALVCVRRTSPLPHGFPPLEEGGGLNRPALQEALNRHGSREAEDALEELARVMGIVYPASDFELCILSLCLVADTEYDLGLAVADTMLERRPDLALSHFAMAVSLGAKGEESAALDGFKEAFALDRAVLDVFAPLVESLYVDHDAAKAREQLEILRHGGFLFRSIEQLQAVRNLFAGAA